MTLIVTVEEADTYFDTRPSSSEWDAIADSADTQKTAYLTQAQNQLEVYYSLDTSVEKHRNAVCEQALYNLKYGPGAEDRASLLGQSVVEAGLIKETYGPGLKLGICVYAQGVLLEYTNSGQSTVRLAELYRDEET